MKRPTRSLVVVSVDDQGGSTVTATNGSYNATIAPGGTASFGFLGSMAAGTNGTPTGFTLNGATCTTA